MSGSFPTTMIPSKVTLTSIHPTFVSVTHSLARQVRSRDGQRWQLAVEFALMNRDQMMEIYAFIMAQRGQYETFTFIPAHLANPRGTGSGTPLVKGASQTGRSVTTDGWANNETVLKAGDVLKFANHDKVYMMTADATSDGSGNATLSIEPALLTSPVDNTAITVDSVPFTVSLGSDTQTIEAAPGVWFEYAVTLVEAP